MTKLWGKESIIKAIKSGRLGGDSSLSAVPEWI